MDKRRILVTSALPNANGSIHLGHLMEHIQTDIWVRFQRMSGNECIYVCADDTHGAATMLRAEELDLTPEALIEATNAEHKTDFAVSQNRILDLRSGCPNELKHIIGGAGSDFQISFMIFKRLFHLHDM